MKDILLEIVGRCRTAAEANLMAREYLQSRILEALQRTGAFEKWAFLGGTALRFLYRLPRFSEDLDFSSISAGVSAEISKAHFQYCMDGVEKAMEKESYEVELKVRSDSVVKSAFIGFPGLPYQMGISPHRAQKISIKAEVDTNPPPLANLETSIVRRHVLLNLLHYDKASLFSGKLHAILQRPHTKGRDLYDLMWYLSDPAWPEPNLPFLQASLAQTGSVMNLAQVEHWRTLIVERIHAMDWNRVVADVAPFLERSEDLSMLTSQNVLKLLHA